MGMGPERCSVAVLSSQGADGELFQARVSSHTSTPGLHPHDMIHKLAVRALLRDYEEGAYCDDPLDHAVIKAGKRQDMVDLSCTYNVVCSLTSFLAIETRDESDRGATFQAPPVAKLLAEESPDLLSYLDWGTGMKEMKEKYEAWTAAPPPVVASLGQPVSPEEMGEEGGERLVTSQVKPLSSLDQLLLTIQKSLDSDDPPDLPVSSLSRNSLFGKQAGKKQDICQEDRKQDEELDLMDALMFLECEEDPEPTPAPVRLSRRLSVGSAEDDMDMGCNLFGLDTCFAESAMDADDRTYEEFTYCRDEEMLCKKECSDDDDDDDEAMGFDLFNGGGASHTPSHSYLTPRAAPEQAQVEEVDEDWGDDMACGLFDDGSDDAYGGGGGYVRSNSNAAPEAEEEADDESEEDMGFGLFGDAEESFAPPPSKPCAPSLAKSLAKFGLTKLPARLQSRSAAKWDSGPYELQKDQRLPRLAAPAKKKSKKKKAASRNEAPPPPPSAAAPPAAGGPPPPMAKGRLSRPKPAPDSRSSLLADIRVSKQPALRAVPQVEKALEREPEGLMNSLMQSLSCRRSISIADEDDDSSDENEWSWDGSSSSSWADIAEEEEEKKKSLQEEEPALNLFSRIKSARAPVKEERSESRRRERRQVVPVAARSGSRDRDRERERKQQQPKESVQVERLFACQVSNMFWNLSDDLEVLLALPPGCLKPRLEAVSYRNYGPSFQVDVERLLATALVLAVLETCMESLSSDQKQRMQRAEQWLMEKEREDISSCYQLGLSSNWRAYARQVLREESSTVGDLLNPLLFM